MVAVSSAESEHIMARCAGEAIGVANTIREVGHEAHVRIWTDAAAARELALRSGNASIKQRETNYFWLPATENTQELKIEKI